MCPEDLPGLALARAEASSQSQPRHAHDSLILGLVTEGTRRIDSAGQSVLVQAGRGFAIAPGQAHACAPEGGPVSYLAFSLDAAHLPANFPLPLPAVWDEAQLADRLERLAEAVRSPAGRMERQSLLAEVLERARGLAGQADLSQADPVLETRLARAVLRAKSLLEESLEDGPGLPDLARACGEDKFVLHRAFTRLTGLPPHAFQTHLRLRRAKELLRAGVSLPLAALESGFCDQSHMHRHFVRLVGHTPAEYAQAHARRG